MQEDFSFEVKRGKLTLSVVVRGTTVTLRDAKGIVAAGPWDAGGYVRYPMGQMLADIVHPVLLDEIDAELRLRIRLQGIQTRAAPLRRSAVGYGG